MDIEAISGPRLTDKPMPAIDMSELEPVAVTQAIKAITWNVRDRVTISPEARQRYEEWREHNRNNSKNRS